MKAKFLYDGDCSFCTQLADHFRSRIDEKNLEFISFRDLSETELQKIHPDLTWNRCEAEVNLVTGGTRLPGFFGVRRMLFWATTYRYFAPLLYLPLIPFLGMGVMYFLKYLKSRKRI
ncbi:DCC1-like thiol-disulfide oxidoreductase family protein [Leptospira idonii]|uniref:DUF393 domain-containing protein n=1 Tax=Leptospira idonii TaxID=1193500 RepID=A0A4R9LWN6_9LEPT|nr:DCC1-like thiol-disulfide oxidoreductase family protein [Leptospira idonii]TGN18650.1 DUF393 domain-containing protein [Leptospira idonii]